MKKQTLVTLLSVSTALLASDPITLDSLFKNQQGLRSITTLQSISSGNASSFATYPELMSVNGGRSWSDVKTLSLTQTFMYGLGNNFDGILSANGSASRKEYFDFASGYGHENSTTFDSLWIGGMYSFESVGLFKPSLSFQTAIYQQEKYMDATAHSGLKSYSARASFRNYSDPVITNLYVGTVKNLTKNIGGTKVNNGDMYLMGFDMSIVLSPKISFDVGMAQRYQTENKVDGTKYSNSAMLSTMNIGATYSINAKSSFAISSSLGGSSQSPDSIMSVSLWQKF